MLRYLTSTLTACALGGMISVFAQQPAPTPQEKEQEQPAPQKTTLTGCVQEAKTTDGATVYVLNKAQGGTDAMYVLAGPPPSEFASHVNHKVEVIGQVQQPSAPPSAQEEPPKDPKVLRPPAVQVESVKMVAESCE